MSIEQRFESNEQKQIKGHFENMIDLAKSDGNIDQKEMDFLKKMASRFSISEEQFDSLLENGNQYSFNPPVSKHDRYDRFINLIRVVVIDEITDPYELKTLKRFAAGLDIPQDSVEPMVKKISLLINEGLENEEIIEQL